MAERHLFTSESVSEGHPDKIADQISDAILDELLKKDTDSRVAVETSVTTGLVLVFGEVSTKAYVNIQQIVRDTIRKIGYTDGKVSMLITVLLLLQSMNNHQTLRKGLMTP